MIKCARCLLTHPSQKEASEVHAAQDRVMAWFCARVKIAAEAPPYVVTGPLRFPLVRKDNPAPIRLPGDRIEQEDSDDVELERDGG